MRSLTIRSGSRRNVVGHLAVVVIGDQGDAEGAEVAEDAAGREWIAFEQLVGNLDDQTTRRQADLGEDAADAGHQGGQEVLLLERG